MSKNAMNSNTPYDMAVLKVEPAPIDFHAIRDAVEKTYGYRIQFGRIQDPLRLRTAWFIPGELNIAAMQESAKLIIGKHDFASFEGKARSRRKTTSFKRNDELVA